MKSRLLFSTIGLMLAFATTPVVAFAQVLTGLQINCSPAKSGVTQNGIVYLAEPAPAGGTVVTLGSSTGLFTVPSSVTVSEGATNAIFNISTSTPSPTTGTISATLGVNTFYETLQTTSGLNDTFCIIPTIGAGGNNQRFTGWVRLSTNAGVGGEVVPLTSANPAATVPSGVTVPQGANVASFNVNLTAVNSSSTGAVTATIRGNNYSVNTTVLPPWLKTISLPFGNTVTGGLPKTAQVQIRTSAPTGGTAINLTSNDAAASVPSTVTVLAGATSANFTVTTYPVGSTVTATITAEYNGIVKTINLTINP